MFNHVSVCVAVVVVVTMSSTFVHGMERPSKASIPRVAERASNTHTKASSFYVSHALDWSDRRPGAMSRRQEVLQTIVKWLSENFDLPATTEHPRIEFVPAKELMAIRYKGSLSDGWGESRSRDGKVHAAHLREVVAVYDDTKKTIFLADDWTGQTPAELSILVHEMVHHQQNMAGHKYPCPEAREILAYEAQAKWLSQFGSDLGKEFKLDPFTIKIMTICMIR